MQNLRPADPVKRTGTAEAIYQEFVNNYIRFNALVQLHVYMVEVCYG